MKVESLQIIRHLREYFHALPDRSRVIYEVSSPRLAERM